jgi:Flp pilus assembly protein TadB
MSKVEQRKQQQATSRRFIFAFIVVAFAIGLLVAWVVPSIVVWLLSAVVIILAALCFEAYVKQSRKPVKRLPGTRRAIR